MTVGTSDGTTRPRQVAPLRQLRAIWDRIHLLPREEPLGPVEYLPTLVIHVALLSAGAILLGIFTVAPPSDWATLLVGTLVVAVMAAYAVRSLLGANTSFSANIFVHLGMALTLGAVGALGASIGDAVGSAIRLRAGWFRSLFNFANFFVSDMAGLAAFLVVLKLHTPDSFGVALASLAAGIAQFAANTLALTGVLRLVTHGEVNTWQAARSLGKAAVYFVGFGFSAFGFVVLHATAGVLGFSAALVPVLLLQGFLVFLAGRIHTHGQETRIHQEARTRLLLDAIDASNQERERIAASIHDGVVQALAGSAFSLAAAATLKPATMKLADRQRVVDLLGEVAESNRSAARDLRTLMVEIAPPKLRELGLEPALLDLVAMCGPGSEPSVQVQADLELSSSQEGLIYRVAQEAVRNVVKYANAKHLVVTVNSGDGEVVLSVVDDGAGFSADQRRQRQDDGHVGLSLLQRTVEDGGGVLEIFSAAGEGTRVSMRLRNDA